MFVCGECGQRHDRPGFCPVDGRPLVATDDPLLGTDVGRYRLASLLGEGGMGRVYLGVQPAIGSRVAVKILSDQCARDPALLERFFAEAKAVNLIRHESIVSVLDLNRLDDGRPYIVMEFVPGHMLGALIAPGVQPAPLGGLVQVIIEVLSALEAAHQIGIVHRDLKPDNILVTGEGHAKVLDFGIAKLAPGLSHLSPRTATGALLGTPAYMAPEQIGGGTIDPRTDIYAAGIVFYEAVTGRVPFAGETLFDLMRQHLETPPVPPSRVRPDLPPPLEQVILTALEKHPARRFQTALAMAEATSQASNTLPPDQWRALSRGGVITGGRASLVKSLGSGRRMSPSSRQPGLAHDRTEPASQRMKPAPYPPAPSAPPPDVFDQTEAALPRGRASAPPPIGDLTAAATPRARGPSAAPPNHPMVAPLGSDVRARAQPSAPPPLGEPWPSVNRPSEPNNPWPSVNRPSEPNNPWPVVNRPSEPNAPFAVRDRPSEPNNPWPSHPNAVRDRPSEPHPYAPREANSQRTGAPILRPHDPASASQTRLAPENRSRKKRWPIVVAILASAAIATIVTLLLVRPGAEVTTTQAQASAESGSATGSSGPANPAPGSGSTAAAPNESASAIATNGSPSPVTRPGGGPATSGKPTPSTTTSGTGPSVPPVIVGGGSAADHGVHIGPGVQTGPGVIIGSNPQPQKPKTGVVDYNPTRFDPLAYLPRARALARQIYPDAELTEFEFYENVLPDGWVDLTLKSSSTSYYEFRSPSHSVFPPTRNATNDDIPCYVVVDITASSIRARIREDDECNHPLRAPPRCTFAQVWKLSGTKDTIPATIGFLTDGQWFFDHDHAAKRSGKATTTSVRDCR